MVIFPYGYPAEWRLPDSNLFVRNGEWARRGTQDDLRRDFGEEYDESWLPDGEWAALIRELFCCRRHNGLPLVRGRMLWESMTWEPGEPMDPSELITAGNWSDESKADSRVRAKAAKRADWRHRRRTHRAGIGSVTRPSGESRARNHRFFVRPGGE